MIKKLSPYLGQTKKTRRIRITLSSCVLFYFIFLGLIAPVIIRSQASKQISELIKRPVQIEKISINPFCNSISIKNFAILEKDKKEFLSWEDFYINFELSSIFTFSWNFDEIALKKPQVKVSRLTAQLFNFSDIIETLNQLPKKEVDEPTPIPPIFIKSFTVTDGQVLVKDLSRGKEKSLEVPAINLSISHFHTKINKDKNNQYDFRILTEHNAGLHWQGQVNISPLSSQGTLKINGAKIKNIYDAFADELPFTIVSGDIGLDLNYTTSFDKKLSFQVNDGQFTLDQFNVEYKDKSPLIQLNAFKISDLSYDLNSQNLIIPLIEVTDTKAYSTLLETGLPKSLRLTELDAFTQALIGEQKAPQKNTSSQSNQKNKISLAKSPINFVIKEFRGNKLNTYFTDESTQEKPHAKIEDIKFSVTNIHSEHSEKFSLTSQFTINDTAKFELNSQGALFPIESTGDIKLNNFQLAFSNPYLTRFQLPITVDQGSLLQNLDYEIALNDEFQLTKGKIKTEIELIDFSVKDDLTDKLLLSDTKILQAYEAVDPNSRIHVLGSLDIMTREAAAEFHIRSINLANAAEHVANELPFKVISGELEFMSRAQAQLGDDFQITASDGAMNLSSLLIQERNGKELIRLDQFSIDGISADLKEQQVSLGKIDLKGFQANAHLNPKKELNFIQATDFSQLIKSLEKYKVKPDASTVPEQEPQTKVKDNSNPWQVNVNEIDLAKINLTFLDESIKQAATQRIDNIHVKVKDLSNKKGHTFTSSIEALINQDAKVSIKSEAGLNPLTLDSHLILEPLSLKNLQNYLAEFLNVKLQECKISTETRISYIDEKAKLSGDFTSTGFQLNDLTDETLLSYESFKIKGFDIDPLMLTVKVEEIQVNEPKIFLELDPNMKLNLASILKESPPTEAPKDQVEVNDKPATKLTPHIEIKKFTLNNAHGKFNDLSINPNFSMSVDKFSGSINNISNNAQQQSDWFFQGFVDNYAPLKMKGQSRFLAKPFALDLNMTLDNLGLTGFSPYTGTFIGYKLQEGQLSLDLDYSLVNNELDGKNKVLMSRFDLGKSVDSEQAVNLPIKLAVALIRDHKKNIDLDLNIHGNINDPSFSVLNLLWKVFSNIIVKAATSPFSLLANLANSGEEDLNLIEFEAGKVSLTEAEQAKLRTLSSALEKRPTLGLNITGYHEYVSDTEQLKHTQLEKRIEKKIAVLKSDKPNLENANALALAQIYEDESGESMNALLASQEQADNTSKSQVLTTPQNEKNIRSSRIRVGGSKFRNRRKTTKAKTTKPELVSNKQAESAERENPTKEEAPVINIEELARTFLLERIEISKDELDQLALNRAQVVKQFLIDELKVPASRIFLLAPKEELNQKTVELNIEAL